MDGGITVEFSYSFLPYQVVTLTPTHLTVELYGYFTVMSGDQPIATYPTFSAARAAKVLLATPVAGSA